MHEVLYCLRKYGSKTKYVEMLPVIGYTKEDALLSAELEYNAETAGRKVSRPDSMIAAIAINSGAKLYTGNTTHFKPFESQGLKLF